MSAPILVTGGAGFIGSNLVRELISRGYRVRVFDNMRRNDPGAMEGLDVDLVVGDILDPRSLGSAMNDVAAVFHLAAFGSVVESVRDPWANFEVNAIGTFNVLNAAREMGVERFLFSSTGGALIGNVEPPVNESSLPKPISPYGASKLVGEAYLNAFGASYAMGTTALRFANIYGPGSAHKKGAITVFAKCLLRDEPIPIYGDGSATRDLLFVGDLCKGLIRALECGDAAGEVFHLASGSGTSVLELAETMRSIAGKPNHPIEFLPGRPGEVHKNFATYDKARSFLGFEPAWSLEDGLRQTWAWFVDQGERVFEVELSDA